MPDDVVQPATPPAAPSAAPVVPATPPVTPTPPVAAATPPEVVLAVTEAPKAPEPPKAAEPAKAPEPVKAAEPPAKTETPKPPEAKAPQPTLLGPEAGKETKEGQSVDPAPPAFEPFTLPDGLKIDPEANGRFTGLLGKFELDTKTEHAKVQGLGQSLMEMYVAELTRFGLTLRGAWDEAHERQTKEWRDAFIADAEWGGNGHMTTVGKAREFITTFGGSPEQQAEIRNLLEVTGLGNNLRVISLFARAMAAKAEGKPLPATTLPATEKPKSKIEKFYGGGQTKAA